jgi:Domain of unknown function (DUF4365)
VSITAQHTKEQLCNAHLTAIAARAGVNLHLGEGCDYGVDGQFRSVEIDGTRRREDGFGIDFQAKASVCWMIVGSHVVFDLEAKTYNDLVSRSAAATAFVVVLLCLPRTTPAWHEVGHDETVLRNACYWLSIAGCQTTNEYKKRVRFPLANLLTAASLQQIIADNRAAREAIYA